jgi:hypothetical protein
MRNDEQQRGHFRIVGAFAGIGSGMSQSLIHIIVQLVEIGIYQV